MSAHEADLKLRASNAVVAIEAALQYDGVDWDEIDDHIIDLQTVVREGQANPAFRAVDDPSTGQKQDGDDA